MEKRRLNPSKSFLAWKKVNPRILSTFKRSFSKKMGKKPSAHIIHSLGGEYCWIIWDSEPIRLLKSRRSLSVYILNIYIKNIYIYIYNLYIYTSFHKGWHFRIIFFFCFIPRNKRKSKKIYIFPISPPFGKGVYTYTYINECRWCSPLNPG